MESELLRFILAYKETLNPSKATSGSITEAVKQVQSSEHQDARFMQLLKYHQYCRAREEKTLLHQHADLFLFNLAKKIQNLQRSLMRHLQEERIQEEMASDGRSNLVQMEGMRLLDFFLDAREKLQGMTSLIAHVEIDRMSLTYDLETAVVILPQVEDEPMADIEVDKENGDEESDDDGAADSQMVSRNLTALLADDENSNDHTIPDSDIVSTDSDH
ncbi:hypothetical protein MBANPS3_012356 [Mucor bainieri]